MNWNESSNVLSSRLHYNCLRTIVLALAFIVLFITSGTVLCILWVLVTRYGLMS